MNDDELKLWTDVLRHFAAEVGSSTAYAVERADEAVQARRATAGSQTTRDVDAENLAERRKELWQRCFVAAISICEVISVAADYAAAAVAEAEKRGML